MSSGWVKNGRGGWACEAAGTDDGAEKGGWGAIEIRHGKGI